MANQDCARMIAERQPVITVHANGDLQRMATHDGARVSGVHQQMMTLDDAHAGRVFGRAFLHSLHGL